MSVAIVILMAMGVISIQDSFTVNAPADRVVDWLVSHPDAVAASMKCRIVSRQEGLLHIVKRTQVGDFEFYARETISRYSNGTAMYTNRLIRSVRGGMTKSDIFVTIRPSGRSTVVNVEASAEVDGIGPIQIRVGLTQAARGFRYLLDSQFRSGAAR